jgi:hypothetical protein
MSKVEGKLPKGLRLRKVPTDIMIFILKRQHETKTRKGILNYSQELTIYQIIREVMNKI